jgi:hypothetical protein
MQEPETKLSWVQRRILHFVWNETQRLERQRSDIRQRARLWGVPWFPSQDLYPSVESLGWSPSDRAVISRALRRLQ